MNAPEVRWRIVTPFLLINTLHSVCQPPPPTSKRNVQSREEAALTAVQFIAAVSAVALSIAQIIAGNTLSVGAPRLFPPTRARLVYGGLGGGTSERRGGHHLRPCVYGRGRGGGGGAGGVDRSGGEDGRGGCDRLSGFCTKEKKVRQ